MVIEGTEDGDALNDSFDVRHVEELPPGGDELRDLGKFIVDLTIGVDWGKWLLQGVQIVRGNAISEDQMGERKMGTGSGRRGKASSTWYPLIGKCIIKAEAVF